MASAPAAAPRSGVLPAGSRVILEVASPVGSAISKRGDMFDIRLAEPIVIDGRVVAPAGTPGQGQVVDAGKSGIGGKPGKLVLAARYLDLGGRRVALRAMKLGWAGDDRSAEVLVTSMIPFVGVAGIFIHGGEIDVAPGTKAVAKLGEDLTAPAQ